MLLFNETLMEMSGQENFIQIHLMLLFNDATPQGNDSIPEFKYISCYYLTKPEIAYPISPGDSNTSHVII